MNKIEVPMYRKDGARVQLKDLLSKVPDNNWDWSVFEFDGVGQMPGKESISGFQEKILQGPRGLVMTWGEMSDFSQAVEHTIDLLVVGAIFIDRLDVGKLLADEFEECEVAIRAIDSTEWILSASSHELLCELESAARNP